MKRELKRKYLPEHYNQDSFMKFHNFKQRELSVEKYTAAFDHLMICCDVLEQVKGRFRKNGPETCFSKKTISRPFRQKRVKFSSGMILSRNTPHSSFGPENRYGGSFVKMDRKRVFREKKKKNTFRGRFRQNLANFTSATIFPRNVPYNSFGPRNRWWGRFHKNR